MATFHEKAIDKDNDYGYTSHEDTKFTYRFSNFFHPLIGELIEKLNKESLPGMMDAKWQDGLKHDFFAALYTPANSRVVQVEYSPKEIDLSRGPYANYNWELFFHIPLTIAVHLSKNQRFAEAQRWFHYIFDPTSNDQSLERPKRFWRFLAFRKQEGMRIEDIVRILSTPAEKLASDTERDQQKILLQGYEAIRNKPFQPHAVARTRQMAYQYSVVMKYLDNLIAWGDHLFQQDTLESINEAMQIYVLAANILGAKPQAIPPLGKVKAKSFAELRKSGLGPIGDAIIELESQFPFNQTPSGNNNQNAGTHALFGIGHTLYFCIPGNEKMLTYWDKVADRLFKIRHCMNIAGVVRPLALFEPPIDPGMLVKATGAGIDIANIVNGLNQPSSPVRALFLLQKAQELCGEVRGLGNALLAALEKGDAEHLVLVRQRHEVQMQQMAQDVRFLQWQSAQQATQSLLTSRSTALERLHYYQRLLGLPQDQNTPDVIALDRRELNEGNFDEAFNTLVAQYDKPLQLNAFPNLQIASEASPASGQGRLYLNQNESAELNTHLPAARDGRNSAAALSTLASVLTFVPEFDAKLAFWGLGAGSKIFGGSKMSDALKILAGIVSNNAAWEQDQAGLAGRTAGYQRRADDWLLQYNLATHELMQIGRQILTSLISEQIAHHEYLNIKQQIENAQEIDQFLHDKFTNEDLYLWMQGEISRLYYEYYRFAFDTARKAERAMKQELMREEIDVQDFVKFNYWDGGRKGLLSGEALHLDIKRMEMAYHEHNKREFELTKHVSLRQLSPIDLLLLKTTGTCQFTIPEWLYDMDCPGHHMRRIKTISLSIPSVVGPYTSINCTLSLLKSTVRKSPLTSDGYARQGANDPRFIDYIGAVQSIVTSSAQNDSGMFETNLRDERMLPFEGTGAESTWKLELPQDYPTFDYATISDIVLHVRYTARQGVIPAQAITALEETLSQASQANLAIPLSIRHDFASEWATYITTPNGTSFKATIQSSHFPYFIRGKHIIITGLDLYRDNATQHQAIGDVSEASDALENQGTFTIDIPRSVLGESYDTQAILMIRYNLTNA